MKCDFPSTLTYWDTFWENAASSPESGAEQLQNALYAYPGEVLANPVLPLLILEIPSLYRTIWQRATAYLFHRRILQHGMTYEFPMDPESTRVLGPGVLEGMEGYPVAWSLEDQEPWSTKWWSGHGEAYHGCDTTEYSEDELIRYREFYVGHADFHEGWREFERNFWHTTSETMAAKNLHPCEKVVWSSRGFARQEV